MPEAAASGHHVRLRSGARDHLDDVARGETIEDLADTDHEHALFANGCRERKRNARTFGRHALDRSRSPERLHRPADYVETDTSARQVVDLRSRRESVHEYEVDELSLTEPRRGFAAD